MQPIIEVAVRSLPSVAVAVGAVLWYFIAVFTMSVELMMCMRALPSRVIARRIDEFAMVLPFFILYLKLYVVLILRAFVTNVLHKGNPHLCVPLFQKPYGF
jgi:hypothetical protein